MNVFHNSSQKKLLATTVSLRVRISAADGRKGSPRTEPARETTQPAFLVQSESSNAVPHDAARTGGNDEPTLPAIESGATAPAVPEESTDADSAGHVVVTGNATLPGSDRQNSTLAEEDGKSVQKAPSSAKTVAGAVTVSADSFAQGRLCVTASRSLTLWLRHQQTCKEFGPYEIRAGKVNEIMLPKGFYNVVDLENGKRRQTTMSFLSDQGQLEF